MSQFIDTLRAMAAFADAQDAQKAFHEAVVAADMEAIMKAKDAWDDAQARIAAVTQKSGSQAANGQNGQNQGA